MDENKTPDVVPQRLIKPVDRAQMWFRTVEVDRLIEQDHPARLLWAAVGELDLSGYYEGLPVTRSREDDRRRIRSC